MIKLFASDLDGTLLKDHQYIEEPNQDALHFLARQGIDIALATGRSDKDIVHFFDLLGMTGHRVSQNGTFVIDKNNQPIIKQAFTNKLSQALYQTIKHYPVYYFVATENQIYFEQEIPILDQLQALFAQPFTQSKNLSNAIEQDLNVSKYMLFAETEPLQVIQAELSVKFKDEIDSFLSAPRCVDIAPAGINKATGLKQLCKTLSIKTNEIAVIGDAQNDIDMLKMTPHSYAMSEADQEVRQAANYVVDHVHEAIGHLQTQGLI